MAKQRLPLHQRFHLAAALILALGLVGAAVVYLAAPAPDSALLAEELMRKQYDFQLERMGGKALVLTTQFTQWFASLWHGRQLAYTLAALSTAAALACFWIGRRLAAGAAHDAAAPTAETPSPAREK